MQLAIQHDYQALSREYSHALDTTAKDHFLERQEQRILAECLSVSIGDRVLNLACGTDRFTSCCTDQADLSAALYKTDFNDPQDQSKSSPQSLRTPYASGAFSAIVCFRLGQDLTTENLEDLFWEASRVCAPGARLIIGLPAAERHQLFRHRVTNGENCNVHTSVDVEDCRGTRWREVAVVGMNLLPVDRLPKWLRKTASRVNDRLCRTPLRKFARSRAYVLELR